MSQETEHSQQSFKMMSLIRPLSLPIEVVDDREEREAVVDERPLVEGQDRHEPDVPAEKPGPARISRTDSGLPISGQSDRAVGRGQDQGKDFRGQEAFGG